MPWNSLVRVRVRVRHGCGRRRRVRHGCGRRRRRRVMRGGGMEKVGW